MPWQETQKMDQKMDFAMKAVNAPNFRELCRQYGISAKTGYKWRDRFIEHGLAGLNEESRRPRSHADAIDGEIVCKMIRLKQAHPHWGPRKIHALYQRRHGASGAPSESSFKRVLEKAGFTEKRRGRRGGRTGGLARGVKTARPNEGGAVGVKGGGGGPPRRRGGPLA